MKIQQSALQMGSSSHAYRKEERQQFVAIARDRPRQATPSTTVDISGQARSAQSAADDTLQSTASLDPRMRLLVSVIEMLTGEPVRLLDSSALEQAAGGESTPAVAQASAPESNFQIITHSVHEEAESVSFSAQGEVTTADGQSIKFSLALTMQRYEREESFTLATGSTGRKQKDPLVLNLTGDQAHLLGETMSFDLNADGTAEQIARLASGSGYLMFDRNNNGKADDGSELFGPGSGNGFGELATLDSDKNGWIDENDAAYAKLQVWQPGSAATGLKEAGVGAIALAHSATPFTLKNAGAELGTVRSSGVFLGDDGSAHTVQQIDLVT